MKIFVLGGTGLLGYHTTRALLDRGHAVATVALPPLPAPGLLPTSVTCRLGNIFQMPDDEVLALLAGNDGFLYAAGLDDRVVLDKPAYPRFREANVDQCMRVLGLARKAGITRAVVCGSYFTHFNRAWPELRLTHFHPYIRSRQEQLDAVLGASGGGMETMVLELPYIFGTMPGRKPLWTFLVNILQGMKPVVLYPQRRGGTAMVTVGQVAQAAVGALEHGTGGRAYALGGVNMAWSEFIPLLLECMGVHRPVVHLPKLLYGPGNAGIARDHARRGKEGWLDLVRLADIMYREAYIDAEPVMAELGYGTDDVHAAIRASVAACLGD